MPNKIAEVLTATGKTFLAFDRIQKDNEELQIRKQEAERAQERLQMARESDNLTKQTLGLKYLSNLSKEFSSIQDKSRQNEWAKLPENQEKILKASSYLGVTPERVIFDMKSQDDVLKRTKETWKASLDGYKKLIRDPNKASIVDILKQQIDSAGTEEEAVKVFQQNTSTLNQALKSSIDEQRPIPLTAAERNTFTERALAEFGINKNLQSNFVPAQRPDEARAAQNLLISMEEKVAQGKGRELAFAEATREAKQGYEVDTKIKKLGLKPEESAAIQQKFGADIYQLPVDKKAQILDLILQSRKRK